MSEKHERKEVLGLLCARASKENVTIHLQIGKAPIAPASDALETRWA
jgi:hypothetical protein